MISEKSLFDGELVRLSATTDADAPIVAGWSRDSYYMRLLDDDPVTPLSIEDARASSPSRYHFMIRTLPEDRLIGFVVLHSFRWSAGSAMMSIGIGEAEYRGKGYGTDAMRLAVGYGFRELNLYRVGLIVISYNAIAIRAYEKVGFTYEGKRRGTIVRDGQRYDELYYGILQSEWAERYGYGQG